MLPQLYEKFQHWSKSGSVWLYSDPHFEDPDCKLMDPHWISPKEQVKIINSKVFKSDTLIILGDIGNVDYIKQLKAGYKVLIAGNHDSGLSNYKRKTLYDAVLHKEDYKDEKELRVSAHNNSPYDEITISSSDLSAFIIADNKLFDEVYGGPLFISDKILLSHEPIDLPFVLNIHGHKHDMQGGQYDQNHYNVCSNCINYTPINLKDIIKTGALNKIDNIHKITIDKASKKY